MFAVQTGRFDGGWTFEFRIPFGVDPVSTGAPYQVWGFNLRRTIRYKNEESHIVAVRRRALPR